MASKNIGVPRDRLGRSRKRSDRYDIRDKVSSEIGRLSAQLAPYKRIMDFDISNEELPKTVTRKIRRYAVAANGRPGETK